MSRYGELWERAAVLRRDVSKALGCKPLNTPRQARWLLKKRAAEIEALIVAWEAAADAAEREPE